MMTMPQRINNLYAWICTDNDGIQVIPRVVMNDLLLPLASADKEHMESFRNYAHTVALENDLTINLVCFSEPEILETYIPDSNFLEGNN